MRLLPHFAPDVILVVQPVLEGSEFDVHIGEQEIQAAVGYGTLERA